MAAKSAKPGSYFIEHGWLEAVIGLPAGLFYGTGIPACVLVMNKKDAKTRKHVLFINADREYREGKAQNFLRPEDIDKIVHAYRTLQWRTVPMAIRAARAGGRNRGRGLQLQHPPLRGQRPAARAARRARPSARRRADCRGRGIAAFLDQLPGPARPLLQAPK